MFFDFDCDCEQPDQVLRVVECKNGTLQYKMQCLGCGLCGNAIAKAKLTKEQMNEATPKDETIRKDYWDRKQNEYRQQKQEQRREWFRKHNAYTRTHIWRAKREAVLRRDGYMCKACESRPAVQVHHLSYKHWGDEPLYDLVSVCDACHKKITAFDRGQYTPDFIQNTEMYLELELEKDNIFDY